VDVAGVVGAAVEAMRPAADGKGIRLGCEVGPGIGPIAGDAGRLQQVAWNLISNAVKFTPVGGQVRVSVRRSGDEVVLAVADTGQGIDVAFLPHLFERFRQADGSTTRRFGGLGLGLSIVKQLVELHGGTVRVESRGVGKGATFTVMLPAKAPARGDGVAAGATADGARRASAGTGLASSLEGVRVLVLDDQADAREIMARMLGHAGAVVRTCETAEDALAALTSGAGADVVVSDIGMPGVDGYEFMRRVREVGGEAGKVPAVAVTAFARSEDRARAIRAGYQAHVAKPVEPAMLITAVAAVYRNRRHSPQG
jgi:CheY-like chemotaxis protein